MARNLEFKAKVNDPSSLEKVFKDHGAVFIDDLRQTDTYFSVQNGRLKFREILGKGSELIFYKRDETSTVGMCSDYDILPVSDLSLKDFLANSFGVKTIVEKERKLLKLENARIHIDYVIGLGDFLEFEVVSAGDEINDSLLLSKLRKSAAPFVLREINCSYSDLMISEPAK